MNTRTGRGWLTTTAVVLVVALAILTMSVTVMVVATATGHPASFRLPTAAVLGLQAEETTLVPGLVIAADSTVGVTLPDPTTAQSAWSLLLSLPALILGGAALTLVLLVVLRARRGEAFSRGVVTTVRAIGLLVLIGGPLVQLLTGLATYGLQNSVSPGAHLSVAFTFDWLIAGVAILALAEVIRHGQGLREELDVVI